MFTLQSSFVGAIAIGDLIKSTLGPKGMVSAAPETQAESRSWVVFKASKPPCTVRSVNPALSFWVLKNIYWTLSSVVEMKAKIFTMRAEISMSMGAMHRHKYIWVRSRNCGCLVTWFCYQLIAKPGNKTATVSWPDPCCLANDNSQYVFHWSFDILYLKWLPRSREM